MNDDENREKWNNSKNTIYLTGGLGTAGPGQFLLAFDRALSNAGIADLNHIRVSSIVPPYTAIVQAAPNTMDFPYGKLTPTVYSTISGTEGEDIAACLVLVQSKMDDRRGVIFETSGRIERMVYSLALSMAMQAMHGRQMEINRTYSISKNYHVKIGEVACIVIAAIMDIQEHGYAIA